MERSAQLCFVQETEAYFTTQDLNQQGGDDWDDVSYESNAGTPYGPPEGDNWKIIKLHFDAPYLLQPCDLQLNSPYSVDMINRGDTPWLFTSDYDSERSIKIMAGTTIEEFKMIILESGGQVFVPISPGNPG